MVRYDFGGKTALITGAARRQGPAHALSYTDTENGVNVVVTGVCETTDGSMSAFAGREELEETVAFAEERGVDALGLEMDATGGSAVETPAVEFEGIDIPATNAGVYARHQFGPDSDSSAGRSVSRKPRAKPRGTPETRPETSR